MEPGRLPYADGENHADQYIGEEEGDDMISGSDDEESDGKVMGKENA